MQYTVYLKDIPTFFHLRGEVLGVPPLHTVLTNTLMELQKHCSESLFHSLNDSLMLRESKLGFIAVPLFALQYTTKRLHFYITKTYH